MIINFPAPEEPPIKATIRLGTIASILVRKFRNHGLILKLRNPYKEINQLIQHKYILDSKNIFKFSCDWKFEMETTHKIEYLNFSRVLKCTCMTYWPA